MASEATESLVREVVAGVVRKSAEISRDGTSEFVQLVRDAQAGNDAALTKVFRRHWSLTLAVSIRVLGNSQEAEDVAQTALTKAFMELGTLENPAAFKAWLCTIATRVAFHRRRQLRTEAKLQEQIAAECNCHPELYLSSNDSFCSPESNTWLDCLRGEERTIFFLRHIDSLELSRIAILTGRSIATVKRRLRDARARLSVLAQHGSAYRRSETTRPIALNNLDPATGRVAT